MPVSKNDSVSRHLGLEEVQRLVASSEQAKKEQEAARNAAHRWPGPYNIRLLAEAVDKRRQFVEFDTGKRFKITYKNQYNSVFISPANGGFAPCGYFPYDRLKEALKNE